MLLSQPVSELTTHIFLPVIEQTAHRILTALALTDVIGDQIFIDTGFTAHSATSDINRNATFGPQSFRIDANIQMNPTSQKFDFYTFHHTTAYGISRNTMRDMYPIYWDPDNLIKIVEMRSPVSIVLNCELTVVSKELAFQTPQQIFNAYENGAVYELNDFAYDYPVPENILSVLYGLWKIDRRKGKPAQVNFLDYLKRNTNGKWQRHKHRDKDQYEIVVPSFDLQTLGTLEYSDDKPQGINEGKLPTGFTIPFQYTIQFAIPTINILHYHPVYNNQVLPMRLVPKGTHRRFNNMEESRRGIDLQRYNERPRLGQQIYAQAMHVPEYDDWVVPSSSPMPSYSQEPFLIVCATVDENEDLSTDLNFEEDFDPEFKIKDYVKEILYQQGERSVEPDALLSVQVYRDNKMLTPYDDTTFTEDLHVKFKARNLTSHYRVVFTECVELSKLNPDWYYLVKKFFPLLNNALKEQIRQNIQNKGEWMDPSWAQNAQNNVHSNNWVLIVGDNGWIYDGFNNTVGHIQDSTRPLRGDSHAFTHTSWIHGYDIIARTTQEFKTRNTK